MGRLRPSELDAVTLDAHGTLLRLADPAAALGAALRARGIERDANAIRAAFAAEVAHYVPRSHEGRDEQSLAGLRRECAAVFLDAAGAALDADEFAPSFVAALRFEEEPGARAAVAGLRSRGLSVAVVSNWDRSLPEHLAIPVDAVVTSAEAGAPKPDPAAFRLALARLGVTAERTLHVGDGDADEQGARAAGLRFARAPLEAVVAAWG